MKIITRYIVSEYIKYFFLCLFAFIILYSSVDVAKDVDHILAQNIAFPIALQYFLFLIPINVNEIFPFIVLITLLISIGGMSRRNEILVLLTNGVSRMNIFKPIFIILMILYMSNVMLGEYLVPVLNERVHYVWNVLIRGNAVYRITEHRDIWLKGKDTYFYNMAMYEPREQVMNEVVISRLSNDNTMILERIDARQGIFIGNDKWRFIDGSHWKFNENNEVEVAEIFDQKIIPLEEKLEIFLDIGKEPEQMNFMELRTYVDAMKHRETQQMDFYRFELHRKLAQPLAVFILCFAAFPLILMTNKHGYMFTLSLGIMYSILYYALLLGLQYIVDIPFINPVFAAWFPNIIFLFLGVFSFKKVYM